MEKTTTLNQAIRTLRDPIKRATYLLHRAGRPLEETRRADPDFLMEVMETRERIAELKGSTNGQTELGRLKEEITGKESQGMSRLDACFGEVPRGAREHEIVKGEAHLAGSAALGGGGPRGPESAT